MPFKCDDTGCPPTPRPWCLYERNIGPLVRVCRWQVDVAIAGEGLQGDLGDPD